MSFRNQFVLTAVLIVALLTQTACPKPNTTELASYGRDVVSALNDTIPILQNAGLDASKLREAVNVGNRLVTALESNQTADAITLTSALITAFEDIVASTNAIQNQRTRTLILAGLAIGNVALHYIANHLPNNAVVSGPLKGSADAQKVVQFKQQKQWRCKNAVNGHFEKIEFCKLNPATSYVVTFSK
jgi:hypothetical protein